MKKTAFVFPGQSSQRIGMLTDLYRESERVRHTFEEASDAVGLDIARICLEGHHGSLQDISIRPYTAFSIIDNLLLQLQHSVKWHHTIDYIQRQHIHTFIELGSGQILSRLLRQHSKTIEIYNYETAADRNRLASSLSQLAEVSA